MPDSRPTHAWKISEVQRLVELPRRDIQRACYKGKGGVGLPSPADSTWGYRTYDCEDLAKLLVASELHREGLSLPEVKQEFDRATEQGQNLAAMLGTRVDRLREQEEELRGRLLKAEALQAKLAGGESEKDGVKHLVEMRIASCALDWLPLECVREAQQAVTTCLGKLRSCLERGEAPGAEATQAAMAACAQECGELAGGGQAARMFVEAVLSDPGMDLALDVWLGSGTWEYVEQAWDVYNDQKEGKAERHGVE